MKIAEVKEQADKICENISRVLIGREKEIRVILAALFAGGHVLVEDRPGTGKTLLAKTFAKSLYLQISCLQMRSIVQHREHSPVCLRQWKSSR